MEFTPVLYFVLLSLIWIIRDNATGSKPCPTGCRCTEYISDALNVECARADLGSIPRNIPTSAKLLDISQNHVTNLSSDAFPRQLLELTELFLEQNEIGFLEPGIFLMTPNLTELHLEDNNLLQISDDNFEGLSKLQSLYISQNWILRLSQYSFRGLQSLTLLVSEENNISIIENGTMQQLPKLAFLRLQNNKLTTLEESLFYGLTSLSHVYLSGNYINNVHPGSFSENPKLCKIFLANNNLTFVPYLPSLVNVTTLNLDNNFIENVTEVSFKHYSNLKTLSLKNNLISYLDYKVFQFLPNLDSFLCSDNQLVRIDSRIGEYINRTGSVDLTGNPWTCDYHLYWITQWPFTKDIFGTCGLPKNYSGRTVTSLTERDFSLPPEEVSLPSVYDFDGSESLAIVCPVFAIPYPNISWSFRGYGGITPSRDYKFKIRGIEGEIVNSSLHFKSPSESIEGIFQCTASNIAGERTFTIKLNYFATTSKGGEKLEAFKLTTPCTVPSDEPPYIHSNVIFILTALVLLCVAAVTANACLLVSRKARARRSSIAPAIIEPRSVSA